MSEAKDASALHPEGALSVPAEASSLERIRSIVIKIQLFSILALLLEAGVALNSLSGSHRIFHGVWTVLTALVLGACLTCGGAEFMYQRRLERLVAALPSGDHPAHIGALLAAMSVTTSPLRFKLRDRVINCLQQVGRSEYPLVVSGADVARICAMLQNDWNASHAEEGRAERVRVVLKALPVIGNRDTLDTLTGMVRVVPAPYPEASSDLIQCRQLLRERVERNAEVAQLVRASSLEESSELLVPAYEQPKGDTSQLLRHVQPVNNESGD